MKTLLLASIFAASAFGQCAFTGNARFTSPVTTTGQGTGTAFTNTAGCSTWILTWQGALSSMTIALQYSTDNVTWDAFPQSTVISGNNPSSGNTGKITVSSSQPYVRANVLSALGPGTVSYSVTGTGGGISGVTVSGTPTNGQVPVASSGTAAAWGTGISISGNAATATALAANGTNCSAGSYPLGVDAAGNSETCTPATTPQIIDCHLACSPTAAQLSHAQVSNYGQAAANIVVTGPAMAAGMNFIMVAGTLQGANSWRYTSTTADVYLDAAGPYTTVGFATPGVGNALSCFSFQIGASTYALRCVTLSGTTTGS